MKKIDEIIAKMSNEEILTYAKDQTDPDLVYLYVVTLIKLGRDEEALTYLVFHRDAYEANPLKYMSIHLNLLVSLNRFQDALDEVDIYKEEPYVSQEVEEYLKSAPKDIKHRQAEYISGLERQNVPLEERLQNYEDAQGLLKDLTSIAEEGTVEKYLPLILEIPLRASNMSVRNYAVLILNGVGYTKEVAFKDFHGNIRLLDMHTIINPFGEVPFNEVEDEFNSLTKDITLNKLGLQIFVLVTFNLFPDNLSDYRHDSLLMAISEVAADLIGYEGEIIYLSDLSEASLDEVSELKPLIEEYMEEPNDGEVN